MSNEWQRGDEWHVEMTWRCSACRHSNLGRYKICTQCGKPKGTDEPFEMPADLSRAARVTDADLLRMAKGGPDWRCAYCRSAQRRQDGTCLRCGASPVSLAELGYAPPPENPGVLEASQPVGYAVPGSLPQPSATGLLDAWQRERAQGAAGAQGASPYAPPAGGPGAVAPKPSFAERRNALPGARPNAGAPPRRPAGRGHGPADVAAAPGAYSDEELASMGVRTHWTPRRVLALASVPALLVVALVAWLVWPRDYPASVTVAVFEHVIAVERYALRAQEGFRENIPPDAQDVRSLGQRVHHHEQVLDHYETVFYTERVQDGYRTEYYSERVACGEDCTSSSPTCRNVCSNSSNGFARCREVCSGGGRSCRTRYCSEQRTRQVPQYRNEQRSRQEPRYRSEPRYAEAFGWSAWRWQPERTARAYGRSTNELRWPDDEAHVGQNLGPGEQERATRTARYLVGIAYNEGRHIAYWVPRGEQAFREWPLGRPLRVHTAGASREVRDGTTGAVLLSHAQLSTTPPADAAPLQ